MGRNRTSWTKESVPKGGRKKGSKNRTTEEIRNFIQHVVDSNLDNLECDLQSMNATNRWIILDKITKYFLPALTKNDNLTTMNGDMSIKVIYEDKPIIKAYITNDDLNKPNNDPASL